MTTRPILFSAEMVRAILDGRKTQTRRVAPIRELNILQHPGDMITWSVSFLKAVKGVLSSHSGGKFSDLQARSIIASQFNPYGKPGDLLWVRETWAPLADCVVLNCAYYRLDHEEARSSGPRVDVKWRPSIHMPRWASRITLRITDIRVERLQNISEEDAKAEGCESPLTGAEAPAAGPGVFLADERTSFAILWNKINGPGAWDENPWVWAISFERLMP
jgi:hypothetical protein